MIDTASADPEGYRSRTHAGSGPLVFAFHGTGGSAAQAFDIARKIMPDASIVAPQGDVLEHGAARFFRRTGEGVYDIADLLARTEKMAGFVKAHKDAAPETPVYGFGYSNGANILASVMMAHPGLFARAGLLHPLIPWAPDPQPGLSGCRVLVTGGKRDPICPLSLTLRLAEWFEGQGAAVDRLMHPGGHELVPEELEALKALLVKA